MNWTTKNKTQLQKKLSFKISPMRFLVLAAAGIALTYSGGPLAAEEIDIEAFYTDTLNTGGELISYGGMGGVAVDNYGYVYIANFNETVWKYNPKSGAIEVLADGLFGSSGNTALPNGDLLQSEFSADRILRIDRKGGVSVFSSEGLKGPVGLAKGPGGDIFAVNCRANNVVRIPAEGGAASVFAMHGGFNCPNGIIGDPDGNLYVVNNPDTKVFKITPDGKASLLVHLPGVGNGHIAYAGGSLYVTQLWNHKVVKVNLDGTYQTIAGSGRPGLEDGRDGQATLRYPNGIAADPSGEILFTNNIEGAMGGGKVPATLILRSTKLPTFRNIVLRAFDEGGIEAMKDAYRDFQQEGKSTKGLSTVAYILVQWGKVEAAIEILRLYVESNPENFSGLRDLGNALAQFGDRQEAFEIYNRALSLEPENEGIKRRIEDLQMHNANP